MDASTQTGDAELNNIDSVAAQLEARYQKHDEPIETPDEDVEDSETVDVDETIDQEDEAPESDEEVSDEEDANEVDDESQFESVAELAEALEMPIDEFMAQVKVKAKINGEESEVTLSNLLKGYQLESDYTRKNKEFLEQQKQFKEQQDAANAKFESELERLGATFNVAQQVLTSEYQSIDWNKLKAENQTEFLLKQQEFGQRKALLDQQVNAAMQQAQAFKDQQKAEQDKVQEQRVLEEKDALLKAIPEWNDEKVVKTEYPEAVAYLSDLGYTDTEMNDHRLYVMARDAITAKQVKSDIDLAKKKVKKAPKLVKPNARQNVNQGKVKKLDQLKSRFKKTGKTDDLQALLMERRS